MTCVTTVDHAGHTALTREHEPDHTDDADQESIDMPCLADVGHEL